MITLKVFIICSIAFVLSSSQVLADFIVAVVPETTALPSGNILYSYTVSNDSNDDEEIIDFSISIDPQSNLDSLVAPEGWSTIYAPGDDLIGWSAAPLATILPGNSAVFSFASALKPGSQPFDITGISADLGSSETYSGTTIGPGTVIPEPTSMIPLGTGLVAVGGYTWYRRRRVR